MHCGGNIIQKLTTNNHITHPPGQEIEYYLMKPHMCAFLITVLSIPGCNHHPTTYSNFLLFYKCTTLLPLVCIFKQKDYFLPFKLKVYNQLLECTVLYPAFLTQH